MLIKTGLPVIGLTLFLSSSGFIYQATILRKWQDQDARYHYFIGLGDYHDKKHPITSDQLQFLHEYLEKMPQGKTQVIVEDLSSRGHQSRGSCGTFSINSRGGVLGGLAQALQGKNIPVHNIEYRYCRVCSLSPILNNISQNPHQFQSARTIVLKQLVDEIQELVAEIQRYNDGPLLTSIYRKKIKEIQKDLKKLGLSRDAQATVADYFERHGDKQPLTFIKQLLTFDSVLLDLSLAHNTINALDRNTIAIAGGSHIAHVSEILQKVGFELVYKNSLSYTKETDLEQCLGSHIIDGAFCVKPNPLDLHVLRQFVLE